MNKKEISVIGLAIVIGFIFLFSLVYNFNPGITGFAVYSQSGDDFSAGSFDSTELGNSLISLTSGSSSGSYTSSVFDAGSSVAWNNISWVTSGIVGIDLPDNQGSDSIDMSSNFLLLHLDSDYTDSSGNGNDGSGVGSLDFSSGVYADAVVIDGGDEYVSVPSSGLDFSDSYSVEFWINPSSSAAQWKTMVERTNSFYFDLITGDRVRVQATGYTNVDSSDGLTRNEWNHVVFTLYNTPTGSDVLKVYINGQESGSYGPAWGTPGSSSSDLRIGGVGGTDYVDGMYDEFAAYTKVLSADEVLERYNRGIASLDAFVRSCDDSECSGESWIDIDDSSPQDLSVDNNQYFQYKFDFTGGDTSPELESVSIDYSVLNSAPTLEINNPSQGDSYSSPADVSLNYSVSDEDDNIESCWYDLNEEVSILDSCNNITFSGLVTGDYNLIVYVNDTNGEQASESVSFSVVNSAPGVSISSPVNQDYVYGSDISLSYDVSDLEGSVESCWYSLGDENITLTNCEATTLSGLEAGDYSLVVYANDSENLVGSDSISFSVVNTAPGVSIISPVNTEYDYGTEIELNYNIEDLEGDLASCWYSLGEENISLEGCDNTSLSGLPTSDYSLIMYANDSSGLEGSDSISFSVVNSAPSVSIVSPVNQLYSSSVELNYNIEDLEGDLASCWYDLNGVNTTLESCDNSTLDLEDDFYDLVLYVNDSENLVGSDSISFSVDVTGVSVSLVEPSGEKTTRNNIPINYNVQGDDVNCWYSVSRGSSIEISNTSLVDCGNSSFNVTVDADFVLNLYVNNTYGSLSSDSSSFSVDTSTEEPTTPTTTTGGSGGGGGGGGSSVPVSSSISLDVSDLGDVIFTKQESKTLELSVQNKLTRTYNKCRLVGIGVSSDDVKNINSGEIVEFIFELSPDTDGNLSIKCLEGSKSINLDVYSIESNYLADINGIEVSENKIVVGYVIESDFDSSGIFNFSLVSDSGVVLDSKQEELTLVKGENTGIIEFNSSEKGMMRVSITKKDAILVEENFISESNSVTGRAITDIVSNTNLWIGVIGLFFAVFAFFIVRRIFMHTKRKRVSGRK